jgi:hypothetical protein
VPSFVKKACERSRILKLSNSCCSLKAGDRHSVEIDLHRHKSTDNRVRQDSVSIARSLVIFAGTAGKDYMMKSDKTRGQVEEQRQLTCC